MTPDTARALMRLPLPLLVGLLLLAAPLLTGCLGTREDPGTPADPAPGGSEEPRSVALYLTGAKGLTLEAPTKADPEQVASGSFFKGWAAGQGLPTWRGAPLNETWNVTGNVSVTFYVTTDKVVGPSQFSSYVAYFGEGDNLLALAGIKSVATITRGQVVEVKGQLELPRGGLLLPAGSVPTALIAPVQTQDEPADLYFLVNSTEHPSRVDLEGVVTTEFTLPTGSRDEATQNGMTLGSAYYVGVRDGLNTVSIPVDATGAEVLEIALKVKRNVGIPDVDMTLHDASGAPVATGSTPYPVELIRLYPQNLAGSEPTYTLKVTSYGSVQADFDVTITKLGS